MAINMTRWLFEIREKRPWLKYVTLSYLSWSKILHLSTRWKETRNTIINGSSATNNCHVHFTKNTYVVDSRQMKYLLYIYVYMVTPQDLYMYLWVHPRPVFLFTAAPKSEKNRVSVENALATPDVLSAARNQACEDLLKENSSRKQVSNAAILKSCHSY